MKKGQQTAFVLPKPHQRREKKSKLQSDTPVIKGCQSEVIHPTPDVNLGDLTEDQKIAVATMLREEA